MSVRDIWTKSFCLRVLNPRNKGCYGEGYWKKT